MNSNSTKQNPAPISFFKKAFVFAVAFGLLGAVGVGTAAAQSVKESAKDVKNTKETEVSTTTASTTKEYIIFTNSCEAIDSIASSTDELVKRSLDAKKKIKSIEKTLDEESVKRETILANIKSILSLKKTDKQVIAEMRKILNKAHAYYLEIDGVTIDMQTFLEEHGACKDADLKTLQAKGVQLEDTLQSEEDYRKLLAQTLKEKMKVITKEIEKTTKK